MIFHIQRYSLHDGEGIRTMVFFKGCPLRCQWCSNPESQSFGPSIMYNPQHCRKMGDCIRAAQPGITLHGNTLSIQPDLIRDKEKLRNVCASRALTVSGMEMSNEDILKEIEKDLPFYRNSKGGVTFSGGEPLAQNGNIVKLMHIIRKKGIHLAVETSLCVPWAKIESCYGLVNCYLVDLKHTDADKFRLFTNGDLGQVLSNLKRLNDKKARLIIRIPVIPGFNHTESEMRRIIDHATSLDSVNEIHFIPYHTLGKEKYTMLGRKYPYENHTSLSEDELQPYLEYARSRGSTAKIGG